MPSSRKFSEERRRALLETQRRTMRVVKRTLLGIALFGAAYYMGLVMKEKKNAQRQASERTGQDAPDSNSQRSTQ